jgi:hypothetical protein
MNAVPKGSKLAPNSGKKCPRKIPMRIAKTT